VVTIASAAEPARAATPAGAAATPPAVAAGAGRLARLPSTPVRVREVVTDGPPSGGLEEPGFHPTLETHPT
jgi:hypothetical protein